MEIRVHIAILVVAEDPSRADPAAADVVAQKAVGGGHSIVARQSVGDSIDAIRAPLKAWIADPEIDVAIVAAGPETQHASAALKPLVDEAVPGFTDLFRWLAFQEIGASAMMASAEAARCGTTFVFVLPSVANAVATAMDKLILPQLDVRATTRNLAAQMPRVRRGSVPLVPSAPVVAEPSADKTEAVPMQLTMERTESGPGLSPRMPAQNIVRKEPAPPKPKPEDATRIISSEQLERKIQQSNQHDAVTRPSVDIARLLPRVPPGADSLDDGETAEIHDVLSPPPFAQEATSTSAQVANIRKLPLVQIPARTKPPSSAPISLKKDESGRVVLPLKDPASGSIGTAKLLVVEQPPVRIAEAVAADTESHTPPADAPAQGDAAQVEDAQVEEITPVRAPRRVVASTPPPVPIVADSRARTREPTPLPLLPKRSRADEDALPRGKFVYPVKRSTTGRNIAIFLALAVIAAVGGIAVVRFLIQKPLPPRPRQELAVPSSVVADAAEVVPPPPIADAAEAPEIEIELGSAAGTTPTPTRPAQVATRHPVAHADAGVAVATVPVVDAGSAVTELPPEDGCNEVACVTTHYEKPCCARWKPAENGYRPHVGIADALDKVMVRAGIDGVKPRVIACGERNAAKGIVKLAVTVAGDGTVKSVGVVEAPLPALGECVAAAVKLAQFAKTTNGGSFNYPFAF